MANRLVAEAQWLESVAADERATAAHLNELSAMNAILHDLKLEGQQGSIDHLVIGPGGAFAVITRRFSEPVVARNGMLFAGERSLKPEIDGAKAVAERLGNLIGLAVVPIIGFHGGILSTAAPQQVEGVYTCAMENLVRVVIRAEYTQLAPHKVTEATERALPLVFNAGSVPRSPVAAAPAPAIEAEVAPTITPWIPSAAKPAAADDAAIQQEALSILREASSPTLPAAAPAPAQAPAAAAVVAAAAPVAEPAPAASAASLFQPIQVPQPAQPLQPFDRSAVESRSAALAEAGGMTPTSLNELSQMAANAGQGLEGGAGKGKGKAKEPKAAKPPKGPAKAATASAGGSGGRSRGFMITVVLSLCVVAAALGAAVAILQNGGGDETDAPDDSGVVATTEVTGSTTLAATTVPGPMAASVAAPPVSFSAVCPAAGSGWSWVADWPGDLAGLTQYDVEYQNPDGTWAAVAPLTSSAVTTMSVAGQPPSATIVFRITAVMQDGSRSVNQSATFTTPASPC